MSSCVPGLLERLLVFLNLLLTRTEGRRKDGLDCFQMQEKKRVGEAEFGFLQSGHVCTR